MFKTLADLIHKTPWWGLLLGGVATLALLVLLSFPVQVVHLVGSGETPAERRAIQHEVGQAVGNKALDAAQGVVYAIRSRTTDARRLRELDRALADIERSRGELAISRNDMDERVIESARDAAEAAMEAATDTAEAALEAAIDAREAVEETRHEAIERLRDKGVDVSGAVQSLDQLLATARQNENSARASLAGMRTLPDTAMASTRAPQTDATKSVVLPAERKDSIRATVISDIWRAVVGSALILVFVPLFLALVIAKFFMGRARQSRDVVVATPATLPTTAWGRVWRGVRRTHSLWAGLLAHSFIALVVVLAGVLLACWIALLAGWMPVQMGGLQLDGIESMAVGSVGLLVGFGATALALAITLAVLYGLGFLLVGLAIFIPAVVLLSTLPVVAPFILMGLGLWWLITPRRKA